MMLLGSSSDCLAGRFTFKELRMAVGSLRVNLDQGEGMPWKTLPDHVPANDAIDIFK